MGYEMGLYTNNKDESSTNDPEFFVCGWNMVELHDAFAALATGKSAVDEYGYFDLVIPVSNLSFIGKLEENINSFKLFSILEGIADIDYDSVYDFVESLPHVVIASMKLAFLVKDATPEETAICRILCERYFDGDWYILSSLFRGYHAILDSGSDIVFLYA